MLYFPIISMAPEYFDKHRGAAMGFILSGNNNNLNDYLLFPY